MARISEEIIDLYDGRERDIETEQPAYATVCFFALDVFVPVRDKYIQDKEAYCSISRHVKKKPNEAKYNESSRSVRN